MSDTGTEGTSDLPDEGFHRRLGLLDATNIVAGAMIGSGIFIVSQDIAAQVGAPGWLLVVWGITAVMTVIVALAYGELAAMYPAAGGQYVYLREAYSPLWGFLYGWTLFTVIQSGSIAAVGMAFAKYLGAIVPAVSSTSWLFQVGTIGDTTIGLSTAHVVAIAMIALLTAVNCVNVDSGKWVQNIFTVAKVVSLLGVALIGFLFIRPDAAIHAPDFWSAHSYAVKDGVITGSEAISGMTLVVALGAAMVGSLFAADAWNNVTFIAGEVKRPRRNIPLSLALGAGGVMVLYLLVNVAYLNLLPFTGLVEAPEQRVAAAAVGGALPWGGLAISVVVMVSTFGCLNGMILTGPRLYWAMAQDGLFFRAAGKLGGKSRVPVTALVLQGIWSAALTLTGRYGDLLDYVITATLIFYVMTVVGIFILRRRAPEVARPYRAWGYPWAPGLYLMFAVAVTLVLLIEKPSYTWPGVGIVALGAPVYALWRWLERRRTNA